MPESATEAARSGPETPARRGLPWTVHAAALVALALLVVIRFHPELTAEPGGNDERAYLRAFHSVADHVSPYRHAPDALDFYYHPTFAALGALLVEELGDRPVAQLLRAANVVGLVACVWLSFLFAPFVPRHCLAAAALFILLGPPALVHGLGNGNLSFAVAGAGLAALTLWGHHPLVAGWLLGLGSVTKPLAPAGALALAFHRTLPGERRHLLAASAGIAIAAVATLSSPYVADYFALRVDVDHWPLVRSISLYHWLHLAHVPATPLATVALVCLVTIWFARREPLDARRLLVVAIAGMTLAAPALWDHTLLVTLPLQVMALARAWARRGRFDARSPARLRAEPLFVLLAVASLELADAIGAAVERLPPAGALLLLALPLGAVCGLAAYVWPDEEPLRSAADRGAFALAERSAAPSGA